MPQRPLWPPSSAKPQQMKRGDPLRPIMQTHTMPPYPSESFAAEEQGTSVVEVHITTAGTVDNCLVFQSSGFARLDQAACDHIQKVWRWQAPTLNGEPVAVSTRVSVKWDIKDGPPPQ
jgi:TonB family protein